MKIKRITNVKLLIPIVILMVFILNSCSQDITIDIPIPESKIVVEGSIEQGLPPIISLTSTVPFYGEVDFGELDNYYVRDYLRD